MRIKPAVYTRRRKKKYFKLAKGYFARKKSCWRLVKTQVEKSLFYATRDRRKKKNEFRKLWIMRINAACRKYGLPYNKFIYGLKKSKVEIDRKHLADLAINDTEAFKNLVRLVSSTLSIPVSI